MSKHNKTGGILKHDIFLTEKQTKHLYKEINPAKGLSIKVKEPSEVENTYQKGIVLDKNKKKNPKQMEAWSILSDHVKYVQHDESDTLHNLNFDPLNYCLNGDLYTEIQEKEMLKASIYFSGISEKLKSDYLDVYDGVYAEVINTNRFDEDMDLSTTYLGQVNMSRKTEVRTEESFAMNAAGHTRGELLDGTDCEILIDTGGSKSYMSKSYFMECRSLHMMPKALSLHSEYVNVISWYDARR